MLHQEIKLEVAILEDAHVPIEKFKELLVRITSDQIEETEHEIKVNLMGKLELTTAKIKIIDVYNLLDKMNVDEETGIYNDKYYEFPVNYGRQFPYYRSQNYLKKEDVYNKITYDVSPPSPEYLIFINSILNEQEFYKKGNFARFRKHILDRFVRIPNEPEETTDLFSLIGFATQYQINRSNTLKITSEDNLGLDKFAKLATSFIFSMSYNRGESIIELKSVEELVGINRVSRISRANTIEEIDSPKRIYISDLVYRYQIAISAENLQLQYLSFYQIIEHFFREIYNKHIVEEIRDSITDPGFSYNRESDIEGIIKIIEKRIKARNADDVNEREALVLTLKRFVDINHLKSELEHHNPGLVSYYNHPVEFLNKYPIDFGSKSENEIFDKISNRIYGIRNSIVHSKRGDKLGCIPLKHDKYLVKEIPLLRYIAEDIIKNSSLGLIDIP